MKKILALAIVGAALVSSSPAWARDDCDNSGWSRHGRYSRHHYGVQIYSYAPPVYYNRYAAAVPVVSCPVQSSVVVVNISNPNGSYTPVTLRIEGGTYVGPRGERYLQMPTEEQLRQVYGLK